MDPEINKYILMNEAKGLVPGYPQSMLDILGKCNIAAVHGSNHKYMRGALVALVSPSMIKAHLLPKIDDFMRSHLSNWDGKVIDIQQKTKEVCSIVKPPKSIIRVLNRSIGIITIGTVVYCLISNSIAPYTDEHWYCRPKIPFCIGCTISDNRYLE